MLSRRVPGMVRFRRGDGLPGGWRIPAGDIYCQYRAEKGCVRRFQRARKPQCPHRAPDRLSLWGTDGADVGTDPEFPCRDRKVEAAPDWIGRHYRLRRLSGDDAGCCVARTACGRTSVANRRLEYHCIHLGLVRFQHQQRMADRSICSGPHSLCHRRVPDAYGHYPDHHRQHEPGARGGHRGLCSSCAHLRTWRGKWRYSASAAAFVGYP